MLVPLPHQPVAQCFNPRPVFRPGDARNMAQGERGRDVSIRARFLGRALLVLADLMAELLQFQSAPGF